MTEAQRIRIGEEDEAAPERSKNEHERSRRPETLAEFSVWLRQQPPSGRTTEEIEAQIAEERNSWGDDPCAR